MRVSPPIYIAGAAIGIALGWAIPACVRHQKERAECQATHSLYFESKRYEPARTEMWVEYIRIGEANIPMYHERDHPPHWYMVRKCDIHGWTFTTEITEASWNELPMQPEQR